MAACHYIAIAIASQPTPPDCPWTPGARVAVWGDSHALALRPFAESLARDRGTLVQPMTMDSCPPVPGAIPADRQNPLRKPRCEARNRLALEALAVPGRYDTVVLGARWSSYTADDGDVSWLSSELDATLSRLADVPEVVLVSAVPALAHPAPTCIAAGRIDECAVRRVAFEASAGPLRQRLRQLARNHPNLRVVDPTAFFCDAIECPVMKDGYGLFWDDDHVSVTAARAFGEAFLAQPARYTLAPVLPAPPAPGITE
jgi:hypothetical protein